jgi:hypothetical protein
MGYVTNQMTPQWNNEGNVVLKTPWNNLCYAKFCCDLQIRSVAAPELLVDTENKKADKRFGLKSVLKITEGQRDSRFVC